MIRKLISKVKQQFHKHAKNFGKYLFIGIVWSFLTVFLMWLFIDVYNIPTIIATTGIQIFLVLLKYVAYKVIGFFKKGLFKYISTVVGFTTANIFSNWFLIDIIHIPTVIAAIIVLYGLFILRFIIFHLIGLTKPEELKK